MCPLPPAGMALQSIKIRGEETLLYYDEKLSSSTAERVLIICPGAETDEILEDILIQLDADADEVLIFVMSIDFVMSICLSSIFTPFICAQVEAEPIVLEYTLDGKPFVLTFNVNMLMTQLDGKCLVCASGLGGAACTMCHHSQEVIESLGITKVMFGIQNLCSRFNVYPL